MPVLSEEAIFNAARRINSPEDRRLYLEQVCGGDPSAADLSRQVRYHQCVAEAVNKALEKVQVAVAQVQWEVK